MPAVLVNFSCVYPVKLGNGEEKGYMAFWFPWKEQSVIAVEYRHCRHFSVLVKFAILSLVSILLVTDCNNYLIALLAVACKLAYSSGH